MHAKTIANQKIKTRKTHRRTTGLSGRAATATATVTTTKKQQSKKKKNERTERQT